MKFLLQIAFFALATHTLFGQDDENASKGIEGAFGIKLGQVFDPSSALGVKDMAGPYYRFKPVGPVAPLNEYFLRITPKTHKVYEIEASWKFRDKAAGINAFSALSSTLEKKYGPLEMASEDNHLFRVRKSDDKILMLTMSDANEGTLQVQYTDIALTVAAGQERREIQAAEAKAGGL